jgi:PAS domain S-box-containing protein
MMVVEDNDVDRAVLEAKLRSAFPDAVLRLAGDLHDLMSHLRQPDCDVVVTDYWLGWSDGLSVLQRVHRRWPRCRVIMLTGNGGEDLAVEALKLGLHDYLVKPDGLDGIVPAVAAAIDHKRRQEQLDLLVSILCSIPEPFVSTNLAGSISAWNRAAERLYGFSADEIIGREWARLIPPPSLAQSRRIEDRVLRGESFAHVRAVHLHKDGRQLDVSLSLGPIVTLDGAISGIARVAHPASR